MLPALETPPAPMFRVSVPPALKVPKTTLKVPLTVSVAWPLFSVTVPVLLTARLLTVPGRAVPVFCVAPS